jgi:hypothetical protein
VSITTNQSDEEENTWQCINCTMKNAKSRKTCEACGGSQLAAMTSLRSTCDKNSQSDEEERDYHQSNDEESTWQCLNCTMKNTKLMKICEACGVSQLAAVASLRHTYDQNSESDGEEIDYHQSDDEESTWQCKICTMKNTKSMKICEACGGSQLAAVTSIRVTCDQNSESDEKETDNHQSDDEENTWQCLNCTMKNTKSMRTCEACGGSQLAAMASLRGTYDQKSQSDEEKTDYYDGRHKAKAKG